MVYNTFNELNGKTLKHGDVVRFGINFYNVVALSSAPFLRNNRSVTNGAIFHYLGIDKLDLSYKIYGLNRGGDFPPAPCLDDLTKMTLVLYAFYEGSPYVDIIEKGSPVMRIYKSDFSKVKKTKMKIGGHELVFHRGFITVGCTNVQYKELKTAYITAKKLKHIK